MDKDGVLLTTAVLPLAIKCTVVARWRSPADGVAGLGGLTVQAHCLSGYSHYPPPQPPAQLSLHQGGYPMVNFGKWEWGWDKELLLERYSFMHSEKSSLLLIVMLFRSKACLRYYGC